MRAETIRQTVSVYNILASLYFCSTHKNMNGSSGRFSLEERNKIILHFPNLPSPEPSHCGPYGNIQKPNLIHTFTGDRKYLHVGGKVYNTCSTDCKRLTCSRENKKVSLG